jgi:ligand-binding sensor domain-containing protein
VAVAVALPWLLAWLRPDHPPVVAGPRGSALPGRWRTFANGDDVLSLAVQGSVVWAGTRAGGLVRWDTATRAYRQYLRPQDPLAGNTVNDIAVDGSGRKWLATDGGLTVFDDRGTLDPGDDVWRSYTASSTNGALPSDDVHAVTVAGGVVWVGTMQVRDLATGAWRGGGLAMLDTRGTERTDDDRWSPVATFDNTAQRNLDGTTRLGLVSDNVQDLLVTPAGNLWVATAPHWRLEQPADIDKEPIWVSVHGGMSYRDTRGTVDPADDRWTPVSCESMQFTVTCNVRALALDAVGNAWAAIGGRGVMYFRADDPNIVDERTRRFDAADGLSDNFVEAIAFGPPDVPALANTVWLATREGGVSVLDHGGTLRDRADDRWNLGRSGPFDTAAGLTRQRVQALAMVPGAIWLGTGPRDGLGGGIQRLDLAAQSLGAALITDRAPPSNFITALDMGRPGSRWAGHVWLGTGSRAPAARRFGAGVADLDTRGTRDPADDSWRTFTALGTDDNGRLPWSGLPGDNIHAVAVQGDKVWVGASETVWDSAAGRYADGGLGLFDGTVWTARRVDNTGSPPGLRDGTVSALAPGCGGELWLGTGNAADNNGGGVAALTVAGDGRDRSTDRWQNFTYADSLLPSNNILGVSVDCAAGRAWVAAAHHDAGGRWEGGGAGVRDFATGKWTKYDTTNGLESYADVSIKIKAEARTVLAGPNGTAWIGTYGTRNTKTVNLVLDRPYWPATLNTWDGAAWRADVLTGAGWVSALARDLSGRLWVGTSRGGLARDDAQPESWRVDRVPPAAAPTATAPGRTATPTRTPAPGTPRLQPGEGGGLWVFDGATWQRLDVTAGIPANDISVVRVGPDGDVWVGTEGWGLARLELNVDPATPTPTYDAPTPTATRTATAELTATTRPTDRPGTTTATASVTRTPTVRPTVTRVRPPRWRVLLPFALKPR